ncbi:E3 ubiquitin-protein ligase ZFP91-like isoform X2 [Sphaeramia orbicularis]|uniref:E3 ubiquitin-protein ligase ZFP91-like isoform X2 n=1 Tax=Sphaeramia orbicularis TaxID=375764 RepID=UPI00117EA54F|nr:E3 ubiquitin-protein ligase ZFP91-like isoform X2 [Sphaeramia orbicularis]
MEAANPSSGSPEPSSRRGVRKSRLRTTPDPGESRVGSGVAERVLRARRKEAGGINESKTVTCRQKPTNVHCRRGRPAGCRSKKRPVKHNTVKKSATKKESKRTPGPKLSKSYKQKAPNKSRGAPRKCNTDANMDTLSCGEEAAAMKQSNDNNADMALKKEPDDLKEKRRQWTVLKEKEESQNEENSIKKEESTENAEQLENALGHNTEAAKKPDAQPKADKTPRQPKRRKKPPLQYVRCEIEGCGTVLAHPRYLQHHIKYQHMLKKEYVCDHPSCGRLFRLQKQLLRHAKHHTDQRDYICEFCARAFKSAHNLAVHRMIHTGEKPIQCEICGFTCRQKASLNWHMKKHDAEASYQFSCPICSKKFERKDCVVAHKAKSHPEVLIAEALASNAGSVKNSHASVSEKVADTVSAAASTDQSSVGQENQEAASGTLTQLQQVVLPLASQINTPQGQFFQLQTCHTVQVVHEQAPTLVHLTPIHLPQISNNSHPQVLQGSTLLNLGPITSLVPAAPLEPQAPQWDGALVAQPHRDRELWEGVGNHQWVREADGQMTGRENELWEEVVVGGGHQDVREMENMWDANGERRKEDEEIDWEREDD